MHPLALAPAAALFACLAGCGGREAPPADTATTGQPAAPPATTPPDDEAGVTRRFDCQAGTTVVVLESGNVRASLPGGEHYDLMPVTGSHPPVYSGDSLLFTMAGPPTDTSAPDAGTREAPAAFLSQQDGERELACSEVH